MTEQPSHPTPGVRVCLAHLLTQGWAGPRQPGRGRFVAVAMVAGVVVVLAWHAVLVGTAFALPPLVPVWFPDLGATLVNLSALLVPLGVIAWAGWWHEAWLRPHLRGSLLVVPVVLLDVTFALAGIRGSSATLVSSAVLFAVLGASEELYSRGVVQRLARPLPPRQRAIWVGLSFGLGHLISAVAFGRPVDDTIAQIISASAFGYVASVLVIRGVSVWLLAVAHGLGNWIQINSPGAAPWPYQLLVAVLQITWGAFLLRSLPDQ